jgi:tetratricopeptide (TPR) repeat protein
MNIIILCIITYFNLLLPVYADDEIFRKAHDVLISTGSETKNIDKAIEILSDGLSKNPCDRNLLRLRVQLYTERGNLENAYSDVKKLVQMKPESSMYKYWECTINEAINRSMNVDTQCYEKVSELAAAELGNKKNTDFGYICALLLAENPRGIVLSKNLLQKLTRSKFYTYIRETLENFDREKFLPHYNQTLK